MQTNYMLNSETKSHQSTRVFNSHNMRVWDHCDPIQKLVLSLWIGLLY